MSNENSVLSYKGLKNTLNKFKNLFERKQDKISGSVGELITIGDNGIITPFSLTTVLDHETIKPDSLDTAKTPGTYWLRDVVSATDFANVGTDGPAHYYGASDSRGVRPYFCIGR